MSIDKLLWEIERPRSGLKKLQIVPSEVDELVRDFIDRFLNLEQNERLRVLGQLKPIHGERFGVFAAHMASLAVRRNNVDDIVYAFMALFLKDGFGDPREDYSTHAKIENSIHKLKLDPRKVFQQAVDNFGFQLNFDNRWLEVFQSPAQAKRRLESLGFCEGLDEDGFRYVPCPKIGP